MALPPTLKTAHELAADREKSCALDKHRAAMFVLTQKDRPIPSLEEMKADLAMDEYAAIKERISTLKADHKSNLERLYFAHGEDYLEDQRLKRDCRDDPTAPQTEAYTRLAELSDKRDIFAATSHHYKYQLSNDITQECIRYSQVLISLEQRRQEIEQLAETDRQRRDAAFPLSFAEFQSKPRDLRIRIATFLLGDARKKEKMMTEFGWAWRQTEPLKKEYSDNLEFQDEVSWLLESLESRDPRKRPTQ